MEYTGPWWPARQENLMELLVIGCVVCVRACVRAGVAEGEKRRVGEPAAGTSYQLNGGNLKLSLVEKCGLNLD